MIIHKTHEGAWVISALVDGYLSSRIYHSYTRSEAIHEFLEEHYSQRSSFPMLDYEDEQCKFCDQATLIYHQYIGDARCESCGHWAGENEGETETSATDYVTFTRRTNPPKLDWLTHQLDEAGIAWYMDGESWHAPILKVRECDLNDAWKILDPVDEIEDDHPMFRESPFEPTNEDRAARIEELVEHYNRIMDPGEPNEGADVCRLACIVADMMHWMNLNSSEPFTRVIELAEYHYEEEQPYVET